MPSVSAVAVTAPFPSAALPSDIAQSVISTAAYATPPSDVARLFSKVVRSAATPANTPRPASTPPASARLRSALLPPLRRVLKMPMPPYSTPPYLLLLVCDVMGVMRHSS